MNGEKFDVYEAMPDDYKRQVDMIYTETSMRYKNVKGINIHTKNSIASMMLDEMVQDFKKSMNTQVDLDTVLSGFDEEVKKIQDDFSTELGGMMMTFDEERKAEIDAAIRRCEENGNTKAIEALKEMRDNIDEAFKLEKFVEFCKTCKIKNVEENLKREYSSTSTRSTRSIAILSMTSDLAQIFWIVILELLICRIHLFVLHSASIVRI